MIDMSLLYIYAIWIGFQMEREREIAIQYELLRPDEMIIIDEARGGGEMIDGDL